MPFLSFAPMFAVVCPVCGLVCNVGCIPNGNREAMPNHEPESVGRATLHGKHQRRVSLAKFSNSPVCSGSGMDAEAVEFSIDGVLS